MKHFMLAIIFLGAVCLTGYSQASMDSVLVQIEKNNTTLTAARKNADAEKMGNKTGLLPMNPEVAFAYLWGNPSGVGNRTDFSFTQTIDFPTVYTYKSQLSDLKNRQAELEYERQRKELLLHARLVCVQLIHQNALFEEYSARMANARQIADAYKAKFDHGETGILDYNKAQVNLLNGSKELERIEIERKALATELERLNGGIPVRFNELNFQQQFLSSDFDQWFAQAEKGNPVLLWIRQEITVSEKQKQLNAALSYPKLSAGYLSEKEIGEHFQGITIGVSIPLWENKNTVAYARAKTSALQSMESDAKLQFYNEMKALHAKVTGLRVSVADYRKQLSAFSNTALLQKALDKGEISLSEYFLELSAYYESVDKLLEMELTLYKAMADLNKYL